MTTSIASTARWAPDSTTILYLGRSASGDRSALYEISFIAGPSRPIAPALTGGDISPLDGQKIAVFQTAGAIVKLVVIRRDGDPCKRGGSRVRQGRRAERTPRWAPDGRNRLRHHRTRDDWGSIDAMDVAVEHRRRSCRTGSSRMIVQRAVVAARRVGSGLRIGAGKHGDVYPPDGSGSAA